MRQSDVATAFVTVALAVVIGLLVINVMRGETERATTGSVLALVLSLAYTVLRSQRDR